jgi:methylglyoxal/glyoxal reductase
LNKKLDNGLMMPMLGLGTFLVSDGQIAYDTISYALKAGYRHIDTAQLYGNEESVGQAIQDANISREDIFITTKQRFHMPLEDAVKNFDESLRKLKTNYVDLYLIHWPNHDKKINQATWAFFESLYESKKVRAIGVCNFTIHHMRDLLETAKIKPMINQVELHPGLPQFPLQKYLEAENIALESYGPFMKGGVFQDHYFETLLEIAKKYQKTVAQIVIAWGLNRNIIMIPKSVTPKRILENFEAKDIKLDLEDINSINKLSRGKRVYTDPDNNPWGVFKPHP